MDTRPSIDSIYEQEREKNISSRFSLTSLSSSETPTSSSGSGPGAHFYWRNSPRGVLRIRWIFSSAPVEAFKYMRYSSP